MQGIQAKFKILVMAGLIMLIGGLIYLNSIHNAFIFDDENFIVRNPNIHHWLGFNIIGDNRFIGTWTFAFNYALSGLKVEGYHAVNILLHIGCGLCVCWLSMLILSTPKLKMTPLAQEKEKLGVWVALLFVTHPVQTMAVDQITQRYVLLGALFFLISLCFYLKARLTSGKSSWSYFILSLATAVMAFFSREATLTLPLIIVMSEVSLLCSNDDFFKRIVSYWQVWAGIVLIPVFIFCVYHFNFQTALGVHYSSQSHQGEIINAYNYFLTESRVMMIYLRLLFWPVNLNFDYDIRLSHSLTDLSVLAGFYVIAVLLFVAWRWRQIYPLLSFGIFWFFLTLSVESSFIPIAYVIAEYRLYLPLFGFCLAFVYMGSTLIRNQKIFSILMGAVILTCTLLTIHRNIIYTNELSLWTDTVLKSPGKARPYSNLAAAYIKDGKYRQAYFYLNRALILDPDNYETLSNLAELYSLTGNWDKAVDINQKLLQINPTAVVYNNLGMVYIGKGDWAQAQQCFLSALKSREAYRYLLEVNLNLAKAYWHQGQINEAIKIYEQLMGHFQDDPRAQYRLERLYLSNKKFPEAIQLAHHILKSGNNDPAGLVAVGDALAVSGYLSMAADFYTKAVSIDYAYPDAYLEYGKIMVYVHQKGAAIRIWQEGLKYNTSDKRFEDSIQQAMAMKN